MEAAGINTGQFDIIIVGAGSAGCVLAGRLSQKRGRRVLLIEAGADLPPGREPSTVLDTFPRSSGDERFLWPGLLAQSCTPGTPRPFDQARVMGGGSTIMGMVALRGAPDDYDEWVRMGCGGWGWADVLPYFKRLERDLDFGGGLHGADGPIPIRRLPRQDWPSFNQAFATVLERRGADIIDDANAVFEDGVARIPISSLPGRRITAAMAYLGREVRRRPNLAIVTRATVEGLVLDGLRVVGVSVRQGDRLRTFRGGQTILAAGALQSPAILMRSGIGPAVDLRRLGLAVTADLPGVGRNLQNHPQIAVSAYLKRQARQPAGIRPHFFNGLRYTSGVMDCPPADMFMSALSKTAWHPAGGLLAALGVAVYKPISRGAVTLSSPDPGQMPHIRFDLVSDERDLMRLAKGLAMACGLFSEPPIANLCGEVFLPTAGRLIQRLRAPTLANAAVSLLAASVLDGPAAVRRWVLARIGQNPQQLLQDPEALSRFVRERATPLGHVAGTCRMGPAANSDCVVDPDGRVHGVGGLRVADASIMPTLMRANTNIPVTMIAEKLAAAVAGEDGPI